MKTIFIGIDISKDTLDVAICKSLEDGIYLNLKVDNSIPGINKLIKRCIKISQDCWFCFEHTGNYGLLLAHLLQSDNLRYSMVPALEIKRSQGMTRGKNDKIDAERIAFYAANSTHKLKVFELPSENLLLVKSLLTYRAQLVNMSRQLQNSLKSHKISSQTIDNTVIISDIEENLKIFKAKIKKTEVEIDKHITSDEQLKKNFLKTRTVKGIGFVIAAYMLVVTNNYTAFENPRKFNCYAGLAPFEHSSGSSIRGKTKTSNLSNKTIKTLMHNGANSAANFDLELKAYYKRKSNEGKPHKLIMNNIACKLVYRIFAVVKRDEPFVNLVR